MESGKGTVYPLEYMSNVLRRVCRSTLQAETLSMIQGHEEAEHFRTVLYALQHGELLGDPLYGDSVPLESTTRPEWIETHSMVSDALTKRMRCPQLLKLMEIGWLAVHRDRTSKKPSGRV